MHVEHISAFSISAETGGNPAGVVICDALPQAAEMQRIAHEVGYSETVFACLEGDAWRTRYFSPIHEVPFCGHATIALGAALANRFGSATFALNLNEANITVDGVNQSGTLSATLSSPPSSSTAPSAAYLQKALNLFGLTPADLSEKVAPTLANAGAGHLILPLASRQRLAEMTYDLASGQSLMAEESLVTIMLVHAETDKKFHVRNAFASGGVVEDPATGAAAAAFGGYLNKIGWTHSGRVEIVQGEDMGMPSALTVNISGPAGSPLRVGGMARFMSDDEIQRPV